MFDQAPLDFVEFLYITTNDDELSLNGMKSQTKCLNQIRNDCANGSQNQED